MDAKVILVSPGPSLIDPMDVCGLIVDAGDGNKITFALRMPFRIAGFRGLWLRFLVWGIRNYVKGI